MTDGKAQRPEASAEAPLGRSEHNPTPEGQGGDIVARLRLLERKGYGPGNFMSTCADAATEIERLRLLSSPRVEEVRREALEEAAKVAEEMAANRDRVSAAASYASWSIAKRIRALSLQVE